MTMHRAPALATAAWLAAFSANAAEVDVQLVLAADVSGSMTDVELRIQRDGYVTALRSQSVSRAILSGALGRAAIAYFEWAGIDEQLMVVPWTIVGSQVELAGFADKVAAGPKLTTTSSATSLSTALLFAAQMFDGNGLTSYRRVIDVSGDGINDDHHPVNQVRDLITRQGTTINAIVVEVTETDVYGPLSYLFQSGNEPLLQYYKQSVIGGPGAFAMTVSNMDDFADTVERKLVLEIAGTSAIQPWSEYAVAFVGATAWVQGAVRRPPVVSRSNGQGGLGHPPGERGRNCECRVF